MYKVFIDHKPIIFVNEDEVINNLISVKEEEVTNFPEDIMGKLAKVDIDHPLQIICKSATIFFNRCFSAYLLIEAAGGVVCREYKYLIIKRNGLWDLPKGKIETGENREVAAIREIEEECGIKNPKIENFITETYHTFYSQGDAILKKTYWYYLTYTGPEDVYPQKEEGITNVEWVSKEKLLAMRGHTYGSINEVLDKFKTDFLKN